MPKLKEPEVLMATNGGYYSINPKTKTVKRVEEEDEETFHANSDITPLEEELARNNTKILYQLIKPEFPGAVLKHNKISVIDFKIWYASHGYEIIDLRNNGEIVNINKWHNDYPTPENVLEFLREFKTKVFTRKPLTREEVEIGELQKLASLGKVTITRDKHNKQVITPTTPEKKKDRLYVDVMRLFDKLKSKEYTVKVFTEKLKQRLPDVLHKDALLLAKQFRLKKKSYRQVNILMEKLIQDYLKAKIDLRLKKYEAAPKKFTAPVLYEPRNLRVEVANLYLSLDGKDQIVSGLHSSRSENYNANFSVKCVEPDIMWLRFDNKGPSGKLYEVVCTLEEYMGMIVLHHLPRAMPLLMKVARGERFEDKVFTSRSFITDQFETFDKNTIAHPVDRWYFCYVCKRILYNGSFKGEFCLEYVWNSGFKKGDKVNVLINENNEWWAAEVISSKGEPLEFRYFNGYTGKATVDYKVLPKNI